MFFRKKRSNKKLINFQVLHIKPKLQTSTKEDDFMEESIATQTSPSVSINDVTDSQEKDEIVSTISENSLTRLEIDQEPMMTAKDIAPVSDSTDKSTDILTVLPEDHDSSRKHVIIDLCKDEPTIIQDMERSFFERVAESQEEHQGDHQEAAICDNPETCDHEVNSDPVKEEVGDTDRQELINSSTNEQDKPKEHKGDKGDSKHEERAKTCLPDLMDTPKKRHSIMVIPSRPNNGFKLQRKSQQNHPSYIPVSVKRLSMVRPPLGSLEGYSSESSTSSASSTYSHQNAFESKIPKFIDKAVAIKPVPSVGSKLPKRKSYAAPVY